MPATFHFHLHNTPNKQGLHWVYLRITLDRKMKFYNTGVRIKKSDWNKEREEVRRSHRKYKKLNNELTLIKSNAEHAYLELNREQRANVDAIKKRMEYASKDNFFTLADEYQEEIKPQSFYTWKQNKVAIEKMRKYHGSDHLPLNLIDVEFLNGLIRFMQSKPYNNKASTIQKNFGAIKSILDKAVSSRLLKDNPMDDSSFKLPNKNRTTSKTKLSLEQIRLIENLNLKEGTNIWNARNAFILSFYFCGMRFGDLAELKWVNLKNDRLEYEMSKTGTSISIPIKDGAKAILYNYIESPGKYIQLNHLDYQRENFWIRSLNIREGLVNHVFSEFLKIKPNGYIFPFLNDLTKNEQKDSGFVRQRISSNNALVNKYLKDVAEAAEIDESISMHVARHSFAQYAVNDKEIPPYKIMMLLGHKSVKTTMQYLKSLDLKTVDTVMDEIF